MAVQVKTALNKRCLQMIQTGRPPIVISGVEYCFVCDYMSKYSVSGYVCGLIGSYESKFKQVNIQKTKDGKQYIMADRKRFWLDHRMPCPMSKETLERELASHMRYKEVLLQMEREGEKLGYAVENQDFYIKNITDYLERMV